MSKILIIAPLTPPYTGNALPVKYIYDSYKDDKCISDHNPIYAKFRLI